MLTFIPWFSSSPEICVQKVNELSRFQTVWTDEDGFLLKPLGIMYSYSQSCDYHAGWNFFYSSFLVFRTWKIDDKVLSEVWYIETHYTVPCKLQYRRCTSCYMSGRRNLLYVCISIYNVPHAMNMNDTCPLILKWRDTTEA